MELFLYLDESGDLGFNFSKGKTSKTFIIEHVQSKIVSEKLL